MRACSMSGSSRVCLPILYCTIRIIIRMLERTIILRIQQIRISNHLRFSTILAKKVANKYKLKDSNQLIGDLERRMRLIRTRRRVTRTLAPTTKARRPAPPMGTNSSSAPIATEASRRTRTRESPTSTRAARARTQMPSCPPRTS